MAPSAPALNPPLILYVSQTKTFSGHQETETEAEVVVVADADPVVVVVVWRCHW